MDTFGVPKKINRHVLKAIYTLNADGFKPNANDICDVVEVTMRNNVPVRNMSSVVTQSLQNMVRFGIICRDGTNYSIQNFDVSPSVSGKSSQDSELSTLEGDDVNNGRVSKRNHFRDGLCFGEDSWAGPSKRRRLSSDRKNKSENFGEVVNLWIKRRPNEVSSDNLTQNEAQNAVEPSNVKAVASDMSNLTENNGRTVQEEDSANLKTTIKTEGTPLCAHRNEDEQEEKKENIVPEENGI